ncbi:hypothetical protein [Sulfurimonas sp.]|uniref:hypothetical protein n=1 Tax=Sulfurimonas sp. TaxID=2022749 RepID=UPI0025F0F2CE|nr:hypothetical protein [Sulfurimonas sp.]
MKAELSDGYYYLSSESDTNILRVSVKEMFNFLREQNIGELPQKYKDLEDEYSKNQDEFVEYISSRQCSYIVKGRDERD